MFFILSKVLYFIIQPLNWLIGLLIWAVFSEQKRKRLLLISIFMSLFFTNHFLFNLVIRAWEPIPLAMSEIKQPYDIGILLGGYTKPAVIPSHDRHNFSKSGNRLFHTLALYKQGKIKNILLSGGSGSLVGKEKNEAIWIYDFLILMGIPPQHIIIESASRNTYENAIFSKEIIESTYPNTRNLLITSAWHMPRAAACFHKAGVDFDTFCVDYVSEEIEWKPSDFLPDKEGFANWEMLIKEWVGIMAYKIRGYL